MNRKPEHGRYCRSTVQGSALCKIRVACFDGSRKGKFPVKRAAKRDRRPCHAPRRIAVRAQLQFRAATSAHSPPSHIPAKLPIALATHHIHEAMSGIVYSELANWDGGYSVSGSQAGNTREPSAVSDSGSPAPASDLTSALETAFPGHDVSGASELAPVASGSSSAATIYPAHPHSRHGATERMSPQDARRSGGFAAQNGRLDAAKKVSARRKECENWRWEIDCYHRILRGYFSARPITSPRRHAKLQFSPPSAKLQDHLAFLLRDSAAHRRARDLHNTLPIP